MKFIKIFELYQDFVSQNYTMFSYCTLLIHIKSFTQYYTLKFTAPNQKSVYMC